MTAVVSFAKIVGAIALVSIYRNYGTVATSGLATGLVMLALGLVVGFYKRLVPFRIPDNNDNVKSSS